MAATRFCIVFCFYRHSSKTMRQAPGCFQLPLFQEILIVLRESWIGAMLLYSVLHPLSSFLTPRFEGLHKKPSTVKYPILFIHGYACNAGYWYPVLRYLSNADVTQLYAINLQPLYLDIPAYAEQVAKKVEMILKETGSEKVILVGHSMGGLVARAFMKWHDGDKVAKLITLQTPHQGTDICTNPLARTFSGDSVSDMLPGSKFLKDLGSPEECKYGGAIPMTSVFSYHDAIITPQESSILSTPNATNVPCAGVGHMILPFVPHIQKLILHELLSCV